MKKNAYITPQLQVFTAEAEDAMLTMSVFEKEISDNYGFVRENNDDWDNIWDGEEDNE